MGKVCDVLHGLKPIIMMIIVQIAFSIINVFYKLCASNGMSLRVLIAYRFIFAAATIVPIALIVERKNRPKLTWKILLQAFVCGLLGGSMSQNLYASSLMSTSITFAAAMTNLIPAITFTLAVLFRIEKLGIRTMAGKAKVGGTLMCISGAMCLTFYKGFEVNIWSTHFDLIKKIQHSGSHTNKSSNTILGLLLSLGACLSSSLSLIFQAKMCQTYPCHYSSTALISIMGSIQAVVYALCVERNWGQWKLGWSFNLLAAAYMGIVGSGLMWAFLMSCVRMRGPLFVSIFNPLLLVLVALSGSLFLNEKLYLGSVVGAVIIICGLYTVLWGKSKELNKIARLVPTVEIADAVQIEEESGGESVVKGFNYVNANVMAVTPNFIPEPESFQIYGEDEDLEAKTSIPR